MKIIKVSLVLISILLICIGVTLASIENKKQKQNKFSLPDSAIEIAPGIFKVGESFDKNNMLVEEYLYVHYVSTHAKKVKVPTENRCYDYISKGMELSSGHNDYFINPTYEGLTDEFIISTIETSIAEWEKVDDVFGEYLGITTKQFVIDDINSISFGDFNVEGVIGVCSVRGYFDGPPSMRKIIEFDVMFDTDFVWGDGEIKGNVMDLQNIATHELGHALGLADLYTNECNQQTMYGYSCYGDISKRDLGVGDIAGINKLYGGI